MPSRRSLSVVVLLATALAGCAGRGTVAGDDAAAEGEGEAPIDFPADALVSADSTSGALHIDVRSSPQPPSVGVWPFQFVVTSAADGAPQRGLAFTVTPYMPEHHHGPTVKPTIEEQGDGIYLVTNVDLMMSGAWELRTSFADDDEAAPAFDVP